MLQTVQQLVAQASENLRCIDAKTAYSECALKGGHVIDVREPGEVDVHPVAGSVNIPRGVLEMKVTELSQDPDAPLYIHCASSARARLAGEQLQRMGYGNVTVIGCDLKTICDVQAAQ